MARDRREQVSVELDSITVDELAIDIERAQPEIGRVDPGGPGAVDARRLLVAAGQPFGRLRRDGDADGGQLDPPGCATGGMISMGMGEEEPANVARVHAVVADIGEDRLDRSAGPRVDHDGPIGRADQVHLAVEAVGRHEVGFAASDQVDAFGQAHRRYRTCGRSLRHW